jgi:hypothetical protein
MAMGNMAKALRDGRKAGALASTASTGGQNPALVTFIGDDGPRTDCLAVLMPVRTYETD